MDAGGGTVHTGQPCRAVRIDRQVRDGGVPDVVWAGRSGSWALRAQECRPRQHPEHRSPPGRGRAGRWPRMRAAALSIVSWVSLLHRRYSTPRPRHGADRVEVCRPWGPTTSPGRRRSTYRRPSHRRDVRGVRTVAMALAISADVGLGSVFWSYECPLCGRFDRHTHDLKHSLLESTAPTRLQRKIRIMPVIFACLAVALVAAVVGIVVTSTTDESSGIAPPPGF